VGEISYPRVDGVVVIHGAFQKGTAIYLPRQRAQKILQYEGWIFRRIRFRKRAAVERQRLRHEFNSRVRSDYLRLLAIERLSELLNAGLSQKDVELMQRGVVPQRYEVHHIIPLDDGGDNALDNLILIRSSCEHSALTAYQNAFTRGLEQDAEVEIDYPVPAQGAIFAIYPPSTAKPVELTLWPKRK
jgi:hypothetical protein